MSKFDDDLHLVPPADYVPPTVNALLRHAGMVDATRAEQLAAIRMWLATNELTPMMKFSIREQGFEELLVAV